MVLKLRRTGEKSNSPTCAVSFKRLLGTHAHDLPRFEIGESLKESGDEGA